MKQKTKWDCFFACMGTHLGRHQYHQAIQHRNRIRKPGERKFQGTDWVQEQHILKSFGITPTTRYASSRIHKSIHLRTCMKPNKPAILMVKSVNNFRSSHAILWDGYRLFDPSKRKKQLDPYRFRLRGYTLMSSSSTINALKYHKGKKSAPSPSPSIEVKWAFNVKVSPKK